MLLPVLLIAGLLAAIAMAFTINVRTEILSRANSVHNARAERVADGLTRLAAWRLASGASQDAAGRRGVAMHCRWSEDVSASIAIQDQGGLVDLNAGPHELFVKLFDGVGVKPGRSTEIADALVDFRDAGSIANGGGEEPAAYPGQSFGPKNAPFQVVEELDQLPGLDQASYRKLLPYLTVHSLQPAPQPALAPQGLRQLLSFPVDGQEQPPPGKNYGIDVIVSLKNGAIFRRKSLVTILRQPGRPYAIMAWTRGGDVGELPIPLAPLAPCLI